MGGKTAANFSRNKRTFAAPLFQYLGNDFFRTPVTVNVSGIDKGHTRVQCCMQGTSGILQADFPPGPTNSPGSEANFRYAFTGFTKNSFFHEYPSLAEL